MQNINCWESKFQACQYSDQLINLLIYLNTMIRIPVDIKIIQKACFYARVYHGDQKRKSKEPYYSHPLIVAYLFALYVGNNKQIYCTTELIVIAILHDTIEDTTLTYDMIVEIFGKTVADGVQDLSRITLYDLKSTAGDTLLSLYPQHKYGLLYVKMFDRLHNTQTLGFKSLDKQLKTIRENTIYFIPAAMDLGMKDVADELERVAYQTLLTPSKASFKDMSFSLVEISFSC